MNYDLRFGEMFAQVKVVVCTIVVLVTCKELTSSNKRGRKCVRYTKIGPLVNPFCKDWESCKRLEECDTEHHHCYTLFEYDRLVSKFIPVGSGCNYFHFHTSRCSDVMHKSNQCIFQIHHDNFVMCCCHGDECNRNLDFTLVEKVLTARTENAIQKTVSSETSTNKRMVLFSLIGIISILTSTVIIFFTRRFYISKAAKRFSSKAQNSLPQKFYQEKQIYCGPCSTVWRGTFCNQTVAIKFFGSNKKGWDVEKAIYTNYNLKHENILSMLCAIETPEQDPAKPVLILEYAFYRSLYDYLRSINRLDIHTMLSFMINIVSGLAFLHKPLVGKPVIAHRDLKSHNVMVMHDLKCRIGDFGYAFAFDESNSKDLKGAEQVGTLRYMAPETLRGVTAYHLEALLHSDIYSLSLVLWELLTRCDVTTVGPYILPYEEHVGQRPSLAAMRHCVLDQNTRPPLNSDWRRHQKLALVCDTLDDCWESDAYARLSAECILMRLSSLTLKSTTLEEVVEFEDDAQDIESLSLLKKQLKLPHRSDELRSDSVEICVHPEEDNGT